MKHDLFPRRLTPDLSEKRTVRVLFASPEIYPLAKTGGLGDVSAALPAALERCGTDIRLVMPGYSAALDLVEAKQRSVPLGKVAGIGGVALVSARMPATGLPVWLIDCPALYRRPGGPYTNERGESWPDNAVRFAVLCHAVAKLAGGAAGSSWYPDVVHLNDWHLGLAPVLLAAQRHPHRPASVFTIHNLAFQGLFPAAMFPRLGLPQEYYCSDGVEFYDQVSFLKAGIRYADRLTTVSPSYAREILTPEYGCGLDGLLRSRAEDLVGILNGIDYEAWAPEDALHVPFPYSLADLAGKRRCKKALQDEIGLGAEPGSPLIAFVSRLTEQKMADLLPEIMPTIVAQDAQFVICGEGERSIEQALRRLVVQYPGRIAVRIGYDESLARRILAGADMLAAPSRFEPCGLIQMYAMRYGTLPIVRHTGGQIETVVDDGDPAIRSGGTGFVFKEPTARGLSNAIVRACFRFKHSAVWREMQTRAMRQDFRWRRSAERYHALYRDLTQHDQQAMARLDRGGTDYELRPAV
jgi:starch synthase